MVECFIVVDVGSSSGSSHDVFLADFTVDLCHLSSCCCVLQQLVVLLQVVDFFSFEEFLSTFNGLFSQFMKHQCGAEPNHFWRRTRESCIVWYQSVNKRASSQIDIHSSKKELKVLV